MKKNGMIALAFVTMLTACSDQAPRCGDDVVLQTLTNLKNQHLDEVFQFFDSQWLYGSPFDSAKGLVYGEYEYSYQREREEYDSSIKKRYCRTEAVVTYRENDTHSKVGGAKSAVEFVAMFSGWTLDLSLNKPKNKTYNYNVQLLSDGTFVVEAYNHLLYPDQRL